MLEDVKSWGYYINSAKFSEICKCPYDLLVLDHRDFDGMPYEPDFVNKVKSKCDNLKYVFAYVSIGEAESYRTYWKPEWNDNPPKWLGYENPTWPGNYTILNIKHHEWMNILQSMVQSAIDAGFDGVYLDKVDAYMDALTDPIDYVLMVRTISNYCKTMKPGFLIIVQNAEELLKTPMYLEVIDGVAKESLFYSKTLYKDIDRNNPNDIEYAISLLDIAVKYNRRVFCVEYVTDKEWAEVEPKLAELNYVGYCGPKMLDSLNLNCSAPATLQILS